jgi:hypothetical protein
MPVIGFHRENAHKKDFFPHFVGKPVGKKNQLTDWLLRLGQFRLEPAPSLFQGFRLSFRRGDDVIRECCE